MAASKKAPSRAGKGVAAARSATRGARSSRQGRGDDAVRSEYRALRYPERELLFPEVDALAAGLLSAGLGALQARGVEEVSRGERLHWALAGERGSARLVVHDDDTMPAMVVEITGPDALVSEIGVLVERYLHIAPAREVIETAEVERHEDPAMLVLAAWVAADDDPMLLDLLERSSTDPSVEVRRAAAKAAATQATPRCRAIVEILLEKEKDERLTTQLRRVLDAWPAPAGRASRA